MSEMFISLNLTEEEHKFLNAVAVLNDTNAERAANQIIVRFLDDLIADCENTPICQMILPGPLEIAPEPLAKQEEKQEEKPKKKGGRPRKTLSEYAKETAAEVAEIEKREKMSKDEFIDYFGGRS